MPVRDKSHLNNLPKKLFVAPPKIREDIFPVQEKLPLPVVNALILRFCPLIVRVPVSVVSFILSPVKQSTDFTPVIDAELTPLTVNT